MADRRRVTLKRVAEEVGVSPMTVSNAFNRPDQLSPALRERILEDARRLGYPGPDPLARGLRRGRAGAIGLVSDTNLSYAFDDPAASAVIAALCAVAEEEGLGVLLVPPGGSVPLSSAVIDGIVVYSVAQGDPLLALAVARRLPAVVIDQPAGTGLAERGHRRRGRRRPVRAAPHGARAPARRRRVVRPRPGRANGARRPRAPPQRALCRVARTAGGVRRRVREAGIDWADVPVHECAGSVRAAGRTAAERLLAADPAPTAILATSDVLALGVLDAAAAGGRRVPADLSVVGFDDVPAAAEAGLTTIRQDHRGKGRLAGELLLAALRDEPAAAQPTLPHELVVRGSTGPAPGA